MIKIIDPSQLKIKVTGVNYAFDGNNANDSYTADVISLSNTNTSLFDFEIYPNPSSEILILKEILIINQQYIFMILMAKSSISID